MKDATTSSRSSKASAGSTGPTPQLLRLRSARLATVAVLIVALLAAGFTRRWAMGIQKRVEATGPHAGGRDAAGPKLANLDSFVLALLLGGLRGPLVMFLWISSESQKNERDLEDFDTKIKLIRLLQPEFDTVHIFQSWNLAYNVSAQMASLPNKYATVLEGIEYLEEVDETRPDNINIMSQLSQLYGHKLGQTAGDKVYYTRRVREDTKWRQQSQSNRQGAARDRLDPMLDPEGRLLAELTRERNPRPPTLPAKVLVPNRLADEFRAAADKAGVAISESAVTRSPDRQVIALTEAEAQKVQAIYAPSAVYYLYADWNTGAELQYLPQYEPYAEGISPLALGYNYARRAQALMNQYHQKPAQLGEYAVDTQPIHSLRIWMEEESERGLRAEMNALGLAEPEKNITDPSLLEAPAQDVRADARVANPAVVGAALRNYRLAARLAHDTRTEVERHLASDADYVHRLSSYNSQMASLWAHEHRLRGHHDYLKALTLPPGDERNALFASAAGHYGESRSWFQALILRHYVPQEDMLSVYETVAPAYRLDATPDGKFKGLADLREQHPEQLNTLYATAIELLARRAQEAERLSRSSNEQVQAQARDVLARINLHAEDRGQYQRFVAKIEARIGVLPSTGPTSRPATQPVLP